MLDRVEPAILHDHVGKPIPLRQFDQLFGTREARSERFFLQDMQPVGKSFQIHVHMRRRNCAVEQQLCGRSLNSFAQIVKAARQE